MYSWIPSNNSMADNSPTLVYAGEHLDTVAGFPALYTFSPADRDNPLIVFIPGGGHNARISYGGHPGRRREDFLAHWLNKLGHGLLAISYPLQSQQEEIMAATAPEFRIRDWGLQAAEVTKMVIESHGLSPKVVLVAWSMGGRVVVPYTQAAKARGLTVELFVSIAAAPGLAGSRPTPAGIKMTSEGYAALDRMSELFLDQVHEQNRLNSSVIIPDDVYLRDYYGHTPVGLLGFGLSYSPERGFVEDRHTSTEDADSYNFRQWPLISALHGDSILDGRHVLADKATWGFMQVQQLVSTLEGRGYRSLSPQCWEEVVRLVHSRPENMCRQIHGNHFFFLGEQGARETAAAIVEQLREARIFMSTLNSLLGS
jgi:pimeloyl-ACP methyl ester carboxylesterase